jgi:hypothetical protein
VAVLLSFVSALTAVVILNHSLMGRELALSSLFLAASWLIWLITIYKRKQLITEQRRAREAFERQRIEWLDKLTAIKGTRIWIAAYLLSRIELDNAYQNFTLKRYDDASKGIKILGLLWACEIGIAALIVHAIWLFYAVEFVGDPVSEIMLTPFFAVPSPLILDVFIFGIYEKVQGRTFDRELHRKLWELGQTFRLPDGKAYEASEAVDTL